jgi:hypothetical protein
MNMRRRNQFFLVVGAFVWLTGITGGYRAMWAFQRKAGERAVAPAIWPESSALARSTEGPTLIVVAHPRCPCTRASITELRQILGSRSGRIARTYVLVLKPLGLPDGWERTEVWRNAASIPGVSVIADVDGREAARLGARTSGQTLLYDRTGKLLFSGGITALRGEAGDNVGVQRVSALLAGAVPDRNTSEVFGCAIRAPGERNGKQQMAGDRFAFPAVSRGETR